MWIERSAASAEATCECDSASAIAVARGSGSGTVRWVTVSAAHVSARTAVATAIAGWAPTRPDSCRARERCATGRVAIEVADT